MSVMKTRCPKSKFASNSCVNVTPLFLLVCTTRICSTLFWTAMSVMETRIQNCIARQIALQHHRSLIRRSTTGDAPLWVSMLITFHLFHLQPVDLFCNFFSQVSKRPLFSLYINVSMRPLYCIGSGKKGGMGP